MNPESVHPISSGHNRIVQIIPWRDVLLALTDQGDVYRLVLPEVAP